MKRGFKRDRGVLFDQYENPDGSTVVVEIPAASAGEPLEPAVRALHLQDLRSGDPLRQHRGARALAGDTSSETLEGLLHALEDGCGAAPQALLGFITEPRVRPALLRSLADTPAERLANVAQAAVVAGGEEVADVLRRRLADLVGDPQTHERADFFNWRAGSLEVVATALLGDDTSNRSAADALVSLLSHPCRRNSLSAALAIGKTLSEGCPEEIAGKLRAALQSALPSRDQWDDAIFDAVAPAFAGSDPGFVFPRCEARLRSTNPETRSMAIGVLGRVASDRSKALLMGHLSMESNPRLSCMIVRYLGVETGAELREATVRHALAADEPSIRFEGTVFLDGVPAQSARAMAEDALQDEPDPVLRSRLQRYV